MPPIAIQNSDSLRSKNEPASLLDSEMAGPQPKAVAGNPLEREGKLVSGKNGRVVADGPFAESKEAIGGYFLLKVETMDEAVAIAQECPGLAYGAVVEVRPLMEQCPISVEAGAHLAETAV